MAKDSIRIAVHDGTYHADDVFALAITVLWAHSKNYDCTMVRTRDNNDIQNCQVVLDIGGEYNPANHRYDHHQSGFSEKRENGIGYASAGLAWKHYGLELCGNDKDVWQEIDDFLIAGIDAIDNGIDLVESKHPSKVYPLSTGNLVNLSRPTWKEVKANPETAMNQSFWKIYESAKQIVQRAILHARDNKEGKKLMHNAYLRAENKKIIIGEYEYPVWMDILASYPEPLFYIYQRSDGSWGAKVARKYGSMSFESRIDFPLEWRGLQTEKLAEVTGVSDVLFCHTSGFMLVTKSKESLIALCERTIESEPIH